MSLNDALHFERLDPHAAAGDLLGGGGSDSAADSSAISPDSNRAENTGAESAGWGTPSRQDSYKSQASPDDSMTSSPVQQILEGLTEQQCEAVTLIKGPLLVLAAAGSGKTTVITRRIANILQHGAPPWSILALTFTNKAAGEMRDRIASLVGSEAQGKKLSNGMTVTTFHSFCARMLRRYAEQAGLQTDYTIYDTSDQKSAMKEAIARLDLSTNNFPPDRVLSFVSSAKNELKGPAACAAETDGFWGRNAVKCYEMYQKILSENNAVDFDDLLLQVATMLRDNDEIRRQLQHRFRYILIDEYQDTNHAQLVIARSLASSDERNICVVGDPDQSIYAWRGADISNILEFQEHYPDAQVVKLGENFRSTDPILKIADHLIKHNRKRQDKPLYTTKEGGESPIVRGCIDEHHEARAVFEWFEELNREHGMQWRDMAIFYRTNALSRVIEKEFHQSGIPYVIVRGTAFYQRKEIKDALAYLRVILNPDDEVNLRRIINRPARGIGNASLQKVEFFAIDENIRLFDALRRVKEVNGLTARSTNAMIKFVKMVDGWQDFAHTANRDVFEPTNELPELVMRILRESGMEDFFKKSGTEEDEERLANLNELVSGTAEFEDELAEILSGMAVTDELVANEGDTDGANANADDFDPFNDPFGPIGMLPEIDGIESTAKVEESTSSAMEDLFAAVREQPQEEAGEDAEPGRPTLIAKLRVFLERASLVADSDAIDSESGAVMMMTFHAAKGLEFPAVAIVGLEEGILPHSMSREENDDVEEERRLFFVGITRAKEWLHITRAQTRALRGNRQSTMTSQFISELPEDEIEWVGDVFSSTFVEYEDEQVPSYQRGGSTASKSASGFAPRYQKKSEFAPTAADRDIKPKQSSEYPVGCRVKHPQFGTGKVESVNRAGSETRLKIKFDHVGIKTLVERYARLQRIS